jgi:RNA polymerase sigma-70 factor (ECF subfamily)
MDVKKLTDENLAVFIQENNGKSFEELIDRFEKPLLRYAFRLSGDMDMSEDIIQESFISAYKNINSFDASRKFSSWIYRITHNFAINNIKKNSKTIPFENDQIKDDRNRISEKSLEIDLEKDKKMLESNLNLLSVKYKEIIVLRYFEDKSYEEISDICHIPISTVGVRISRGLKILKDKIGSRHG